jgi:coenzyme PQQ precursor peptide PqqA
MVRNRIEMITQLVQGRRTPMKLEWHKPEVVEEEVGLEVTSYASAELDRS